MVIYVILTSYKIVSNDDFHGFCSGRYDLAEFEKGRKTNNAILPYIIIRTLASTRQSVVVRTCVGHIFTRDKLNNYLGLSMFMKMRKKNDLVSMNILEIKKTCPLYVLGYHRTSEI